MNQINIDGYIRITKYKAIKRFNEGKATYMLPYKIRPGNMWIQPIPVPGGDAYNAFTDIVNAFEYYNCNNETGRYASFYKMEEKIQ